MTEAMTGRDKLAAVVDDIFARNVIWDGHSGFLPNPAADLNELSRWRDAGVNYLSIDVGFDLLDWHDTLRNIAAFRSWIAANSDRFVMVESVHQIQRAKAEGKLAITFDVEGANALDGRLEMVGVYHRLGVRQMVLAYNVNNLAAGGCHDEDMGLTPFGAQVVDEMNRLGMFVDLSHCAYRTTMDVMERSGQPVVFSHSNPRRLVDHDRNIRDDQIRACAATGGLVGVVGLEIFMGRDASSQTYCDHICYLADMIGPEHVGFTLDHSFAVDAPGADEMFEQNPQFWPLAQYAGRRHGQVLPAQLREVTSILLQRGMARRDVEAILGGNFMRLAGQIWR